jgi:transmembrane 9 superfamily member 2/4
VVRVPAYPMLLSFLMGTGTQVWIIAYTFLTSASAGFFTPYQRYMWIIALFVIIAVAGWFNGYVTGRCMKSAGLNDWRSSAAISAFVYPALSMACFAIIDLIEAMEKADSVPFTWMFFYCVIWTVVNAATCYHGSKRGFCDPSWADDRKPSPVKRKIPKQPFWLDLKILAPVCGGIIFTTIFVEF